MCSSFLNFALQVVRTLVMPGNPAQVTMSSQKTMKACGLLETLCNILMASGVPADILTETISTVAEVIRGNQGNQEYFANVMAPSNPPRYFTGELRTYAQFACVLTCHKTSSASESVR